MKAYNLTSNNGNKVPNQLEIIDNNGTKYFQSYNSIIIKQTTNNTYLDSYYYNSVTSYIRILKGATYIELDINQKINPGFMISNDMALKLCNPHTFSNKSMGTNILLTANKTNNSNYLPLL